MIFLQMMIEQSACRHNEGGTSNEPQNVLNAFRSDWTHSDVQTFHEKNAKTNDEKVLMSCPLQSRGFFIV
jgi:hypothetical protein